VSAADPERSPADPERSPADPERSPADPERSPVHPERSRGRPLIKPGGPLASAGAWILFSFVRALPRGAREALASGFASLAYALGIRRRVTLENLAAAFPEKSDPERRRIARGAYRNMALAVVEAVVVDRLSDAELAKAVVTDDWARVDAALAVGKGLLVASAHFGSWELFAEVMCRRGIKLNAVVRPLEGAINARLVESRREAGLGLIAARGAIKESVKAVRRGEVVAMLVDQVIAREHGVFVPFFGRPASTSPALSAAAKRSGAPVLVALAAREGNHLRLFIEGPFPVPSAEEHRGDLTAHMAQLTAVIERYIRRYPDQWLWLHRRWKES
jgi:Kdo2-lipid IVA lauroyltransferase/acyltransferase